MSPSSHSDVPAPGPDPSGLTVPLPGFRARGGWWVVAQAILMLAVVVLGVAAPGDWTRPWLSAIGVVLFLIGGAVGVVGLRALGVNRTPFPMPGQGSRLVRDGIYSRVRHPLYTSVMLASLGWGLLWESAPAAVMALALIPFFDAKARREERWLRARYADYAAYESRVRRFIPGCY